jgi:hypothetical protein
LGGGLADGRGCWVEGLDPGFEAFHSGAEGNLSWKTYTFGLISDCAHTHAHIHRHTQMMMTRVERGVPKDTLVSTVIRAEFHAGCGQRAQLFPPPYLQLFHKLLFLLNKTTSRPGVINTIIIIIIIIIIYIK